LSFFSSFGGVVVSDFGGVPESFELVDGGVVLGPVVDGGFVVPVGVVGPQPTASKPVRTNNATSFLMITPSFRVSPWREGIRSRTARRRRLINWDAPGIELFPGARLLEKSLMPAQPQQAA
jgi:hypothetical protein